MAVEVVGIFNSQSQQVIPSAVIIKAVIKETAKAMEHPIESGGTIVDHRIILPNEIELSMIFRPADYKNVYGQLRKLFINSDLLTVQTRTARYSRMMIVAMPHEESPDMFDTIAVALTLREVKLVRSLYGTVPLTQDQVKNPADQSTVNTGQQQPKSAAKDLLDRALTAIASR